MNSTNAPAGSLPTVSFGKTAAQRAKLRLRPWVILASVGALLCLSTEIEVLKHVDSLSLYLTYSEVAVVAGIALLFSLGAAITLWICALLVTQIACLLPVLKRYRVFLGWYLALTAAFSSFFLEAFNAIGLLVFSQWKPSLQKQIVIVCGFVIFWLVGLICIGIRRLQDFCAARLVPVFWVHVALGMVILLLLLSDGARPFRGYAQPGHAVAASQLPDIYLITIDALRAADTSVYGYDRVTTPNLQRFAQRSFTFDYFFSNSNFTTPGATSIETGKLPWSHRVFQFNGFLRGEAKHDNLAALLRERGYYTAMISSNYPATPLAHRTLSSYDAVEYVPPLGFAGYWLGLVTLTESKHQYVLGAALPNRLGLVRSMVDALLWPHRYPSPAEAVFNRARSLLERRDIEQPRFLWTHILPPHDPYLPPDGYQTQFLPSMAMPRYQDFLLMQNGKLPPGVSIAQLKAQYDEMVLYADAVVGDYLNWLDRTGRLDRAIVIITSDHGESFEHNLLFHGGPNLGNGVIRIPLMVHLPGQREGARISQAAQQADLLPTVSDLVGSPVPSWTDGTSLKPLLQGKVLPSRFLFSMNLEPNSAFGTVTRGEVAVLNDEFKYETVLGSEPQERALYRYRIDPFEEHDLTLEEPRTASYLNNVLLDKLKEINGRWPAPK